MIFRNLTMIALFSAAMPLAAQNAKPFDAAAAFGARDSVAHMRLSPDGMSVVYVTPAAGQGSVVYTLDLTKGSTARPVLSASGNPERIARCDWVSNERLVCDIYGVTKQNIALQPVPFSRLVAVNANASNPRVLSTVENAHSRGWQIGGGNVVDWLPDEDSAALIERARLPDDRIGSRLGSQKQGLAVDWIDTRSLAFKTVEEPHDGVVDYISDGRGAVRIVAIRTHQGAGQDRGVINYSYRPQGSHEWQKLSDYNERERSGFIPETVDHDLNVAYGFKKKDGRLAVYSIALDGSLRENLIYARPDVDVDGLIRIGRRQRVVGVSYATDVRRSVYFDPDIESMSASLSKALPGNPLVSVVDSSMDESRLLILAGGDVDPGVYYVFDRSSHQLQTFLVVRNQPASNTSPIAVRQDLNPFCWNHASP